jgi:predicted nucleotidyltransferase
MKRALQRLAIRTQFPPFIWLYQAVYRLAIRLCLRRFRAMGGVRAVYLRRGLVSGEPFYGLSDIDLLVLIDAEHARRLTSRLEYQYDLIRQLFPMLAEGELAIYTVRSLQLLYKYSAFYRQRFDRGRREWQRLYGEDIFAHVPPAAQGTAVPAVHELGPAWHYLSQELSPQDERPLYLRKYVAFKWLADTARTALAAQGETAHLSRQMALRQASTLFPAIATTLQNVSGFRHKLLACDPIPINEVLASYVQLARAALATQAHIPCFHRPLRIGAPQVGETGVYLRQESLALIEQVADSLDSTQRAILVPRLNLTPLAQLGMDVSQLAGATMDAFDLVLVGERLPAMQTLRAFTEHLSVLRPALDVYFCDGQLALALQTVQGWPIRTPNQEPEFFALLSSPQPLRGRVEIAGSVELQRPFAHADALLQRAKSWLALFQTGDAFRLPVLGFWALFWEAGRAAWMATQSANSIIDMPTGSAQLVEALCAWTPQAEPVLRQIHEEYLRTVRDQPSEAIRYVYWAGQYARQLGALLDSPAPSDLKPQTAPRIKLTISVVIATRNRAALLDKALASLLGQVRRPDQVVVVDNASSDHTLSVARSYAGALNMTVIREEKVGVSHARNAGLAAATGDIVASMDDDCEADPCWLEELERPFLKDPRIGAVGGRIEPVEGQRGLVARFYRSRMQSNPAHRPEQKGAQ